MKLLKEIGSWVAIGVIWGLGIWIAVS